MAMKWTSWALFEWHPRNQIRHRPTTRTSTPLISGVKNAGRLNQREHTTALFVGDVYWEWVRNAVSTALSTIILIHCRSSLPVVKYLPRKSIHQAPKLSDTKCTHVGTLELYRIPSLPLMYHNTLLLPIRSLAQNCRCRFHESSWSGKLIRVGIFVPKLTRNLCRTKKQLW